MPPSDSLQRVLKWRSIFQNAKYAPLGNEKPQGEGSKYTNFSLQHIMEKYNFLPTMMLQREFLLNLGYKNPELVEDAILKHPKYTLYVHCDIPPPTGECPVSLKTNEHDH